MDDKRSTLIDRAKGKMSPGLYMRDIAEVRAGFDSFDFKKNANAPTDPDLCLSLIGSERTISLELPGKVRAYLCEDLSDELQDCDTLIEI